MSDVARQQFRRLISPLAWTLYIALPMAGWGWLNGVPIGPFEVFAIGLVWWAWAARRQLPGGRVVLVLALAKMLLGPVLVERGFSARYYANDGWAAPVQRSVEFRRDDITRHDERLAFGRYGQPDLPLFFFNDLRFNFYLPTEPSRERLPFSADWNGALQGVEGRPRVTVYLDVPDDVSGEVLFDGRAVQLTGAPEHTGTVRLAPGWHSLTVKMKAPYDTGRRFEAGEIIDGVRRPFDGDRVLIRPASDGRLVADVLVSWIAKGADLLVLSWLAWIVAIRWRAAWFDLRIGRMLWLAAIGEALLYALPYARRFTLLSGGNDWLTYESFARAIALGDVMLLGGAAVGHGSAFYYQVLYPYFVALTHIVFGDDLFGVVFTQRLFVAASVAGVASITSHLFGARAGRIALIGGGAFMYAKAGRWAALLLAEPFFIPLFVGWILLLIRTAIDGPTLWRLVVTGVTGGLATLTRATLLLGWPLILPPWAVSLRRARFQSAALMLVVMIAIVGVATLRNWVVSRTFVPVTSGFANNLAMGNVPVHPLAPTPADRLAYYRRLGVTPPVQGVIEFAIQAPGDFLLNLGRKALYSVGFFELSGIQSETGTSWLYVGMWCAAILGAARLYRSPVPHPLPLIALPAVAALTHLMALVAIVVSTYADRMILPAYPLLIPYAAFALEPVVESARRNIWSVALVVSVALALSLALPVSTRSLDSTAALIVVSALLATAATGRPRITSSVWLYLAYAAGIIVVLLSERSSNHYDFARELLFPIAIFAVARLAQEPATQRAIAGALLAAAFVMTWRASGEIFTPAILWAGAAVLAAALSVAVRGWTGVSRTAAVAAGACMVVALLLPTLRDVHVETLERLEDIHRDVRNMTGGDPQARSDLTNDLRVLMEGLHVYFRQFRAARYDQIGRVATMCLFGLWVRAIVMSGRRGVRDNSRVLLGCCAALTMALPLALVGGVPVAGWRADAYPVVALAILIGLAEAVPSERRAELTKAG